MTHSEFETKEKQILEEIEEKGRNAREQTGLVSTLPQIGRVLVGYWGALRYGEADTRQIAEFSQRVADSVGGRALVYNGSNIHQTIFDHEVLAVEEGSFTPDEAVLDALFESVQEAYHWHPSVMPKTRFGRYIHSADSVMLRPESNEGNLDLILAVNEFSARKGLEIRPTWGRHITVSRFTSDIPIGEMTAFNRVMVGATYQHLGAGSIDAVSLEVGHFLFDRKKSEFNLVPINSIEL